MKEKLQKFYKDNFLVLILFLVFIITYILFLGSYPLLDVDETRYVTMARDMFNTKDFLTLYLNGEYFFEKPPLYFWLECFSFLLFGKISEFSARFPLVILSILPLVLLFFLSKKVKNKEFAFLNCAILMTTLEYIIITKTAILDSVLTSFVSSSIIAYFFTFFAEKNNKKYFWWLTYIFSAFAVMAKGVPGVALVVAIIFVSTIVFKTYKDTLKNIPFGLLLFLLITLPWHIIMQVKYGSLFFDEYIIKHHLLRFLGSDVIHRSQPFWFYIATLAWGLFPWIFSLIIDLAKKIKNKAFKLDLTSDFNKFIILNLIAVIMIFSFFTSSETKLITYILPIYPFFAVLIGNIWYKFIFENENKKKKRYNLFFIIIFSMAFLSCFLTPLALKFDYTFGQNDLIKFAKLAKENNYTISTFETGKKYSLLYYSGLKKICFRSVNDLHILKKELSKKNNYVVVRNEIISKLPFKVFIKHKGIKYSILKSKPN